MKKLTDKYLLDFLDYLKEQRGYSDLTLKTYSTALNEAFDYIETEKTKNTYRLNLVPYRFHIKENSKKTITKKLSAIRSFAEFLKTKKLKVVIKGDESIKVPKTLPKPIETKYIKEAIQTSDEETRLIIMMFFGLGLRISELSNIKLKDISKEWIRIKGKGNKERDVPILEEIYDKINIYIKKFNPKRYLFEKNGEKLSENRIRYLIDKSFKKIGIKATPHQLRHSFATSLLNEGANIADVSELLGHSSMATTQIYTKLKAGLKQENYKKAHPLCGEKL